MSSRPGIDGDIPLPDMDKPIGTQSEGRHAIPPLRHVLRPMLLSMRIFGLIYGDVFADEQTNRINAVNPDKSEDIRDKRKLRTWRFGKIYCACVGVVLYALLAVLVSFTIQASGFKTISRVLGLALVFLLCALQSTICVLTISRTQNGSRFFRFLTVMEEAYSTQDSLPTSRQAKVVMYLGWAVIASNAIMITCILSVPYTSTTSMSLFFGDISMYDSSWVAVVFSLFSPFFSAAWILPTVFYVMTCHIIAERFAHLTTKASKILKDNQGDIDVSKLRADHLGLCHAVEALDEVLSPLALVSYGCNIPILCFILNVTIVMINQKFPSYQIAILVFWNMCILSATIISSLAGAYVNTKAHSLTKVVYNIDVKKIDSAQRTELMLLLTKLNQETISPTIGGIVPVTRGMLLTVFGTIVGYLTILIQFN